MLLKMEASMELETKEEEKSDAPPCCVGCVRWKSFGKKCWYYWEDKKHCTMWTCDWDEAAMQQF